MASESVGDVVTLQDGIDMVQGLISWLKRCDQTPLFYKEGDTLVECVPDAQRAGKILNLLMHSAGMA